MVVEKKSILIVDDEKDVVELVSLVLVSNGYKIFTAFDGNEAINFLRDSMIKPDLILLDIFMPKVNGYEVCRWVRQEADFKDIPIFILTAKVKEGSEEKARKNGCNEFVFKPFTIKYLLQTINSLIRE